MLIFDPGEDDSGIDHVVTLSENPNSGLPARLEENPSDPPTVSAHKPIKPLAASIPFFLANWGALANEHNGALQKNYFHNDKVVLYHFF